MSSGSELLGFLALLPQLRCPRSQLLETKLAVWGKAFPAARGRRLFWVPFRLRHRLPM